MDYLPVFLDISNKHCLVVGGGSVALRKVSLLLQAGAQVHVVSPSLDTDLIEFVRQQKITHDAQDFKPEHLKIMHW